MRKNLLFLLVLTLFATQVRAQLVDPGFKIIGSVPAPVKKNLNRSASNPVNCSSDTLTYPSMGASGYNSVTVKKGSALGQFFSAPGEVTVSGFRFYGFAILPTSGPAKKIRTICNVYKAGTDSLPTGSPLASDTITIDTVSGTSIPLSSITHVANFKKSVKFTNDHFIVTVESDSNDVSLAVVTNSYTNGDGEGRNIGCGSVSGKWYRCLNLNIAGNTFDAHMQFFPIVKYQFGTDFSTTQDCYTSFDTLRFAGNYKKTPMGAVYYNYYAYLDELYPTIKYLDYCNTWLFENTTYANGRDGKYKPKIRRNIDVQLFSTIYTYSNSNYCRDTAKQTIYYTPLLPVLSKGGNGCIGDSAKILLSADPNATIEWYKKVTDVNPFNYGMSYTIKKVTTSDTFYVRAVNNKCVSKHSMIVFNAYQYPSYLTTQGDSICSGGSANLTAKSDRGDILWYSDLTIQTPLYTGNAYTTGKLTKDSSLYVVANNGGCLSPGGRTKVTALVGSSFAPETPLLSFSDTAVCAKTGSRVIDLKASVVTSDTLRWFADVTSTTVLGRGTSYTYTAPSTRGTYSMYVESWNGICGSGRNPITIHVYNNATVFGATGDVICSGDSADLAGIPQWGEIRWYDSKTAATPFSTATALKVGDVKSNRYFYYKSAEGKCEAVSFDSVEVKVNTVPTPSSVDANPVCAKALGELTVNVTGATVNWYDDITATTPIATGNTLKVGQVLSNLTYYYEVTNKGCSSGKTMVELKVLPRPVAGFTWSLIWQNKLNCVPITTTGLTIFWEWGDGQTKSGLPGVHQYASSGSYTVRMIATNNTNGCKDTAEIPVLVDHTGVNQSLQLLDVAVYPNPVQNGELLQLSGLIAAQNSKASWMSLQGSIINEVTFDGNEVQVPAGMTPGLYFLVIEQSNQKYTPIKVLVK